MQQKILVTGTAGFIGFHLTEALLQAGHLVVGIDNINDYYDTRFKFGRLSEAGIRKEQIAWYQEAGSVKHQGYRFIQMNLEDKQELMDLCRRESFDMIINLAAQAGVRYSIQNPDAYIQSNIVGFLNILEAARHYPVKHLIYASSSSVYGMNTKMPFSVTDNVDHPVSLYAATKKANELMAHTYSHLYGMRTTGLRFFTVYGPWGRPDMAYFLFAEAIQKKQPIKVFNHGKLKRDFTYIDDIVQGIMNIIGQGRDVLKDKPLYKVYNIGNNQPLELMDFIECIGKCMDKKPILQMEEMQPGDVMATWADIDDLKNEFSYRPCTPLIIGISNFIKWFNDYKFK